MLAAQSPKALNNGDFEAPPGKDGSIPGWKLEVGARNGADEPRSSVTLDSQVKRQGRCSLRLSGDDTTRAWLTPGQELPVRPDGVYRLHGWFKAERVRGEKVRGTGIAQFPNCHVAVWFLDENEESAGTQYESPGLPTSDWQEFVVEAKAAPSARKGGIGISLTMSGTFWVDDLSLEIKGGKEPPKPKRVFEAGFEKTTEVPSPWKEELGASNGGAEVRSAIAIDREEGAPGSPRSVKFSGDVATTRWYGLVRTLDSGPGDSLRLSAMVKAKEVRREGIQFPNLHIRIVFLDDDGKPIGRAQYGAPGEGSYDWKKVEVSGVGPEGTKKALCGLFLSMSGDAWFDQIALDRLPTMDVPYAGWGTLKTKHLVLRYPPGVRAVSMQQLGKRLDEAYEDIRKRLAVTYDDPITVFLYRDMEQGKQLTGGDLDFASPETRTVHQTFNSTPAHEMVHVIGVKMGTPETHLLGEGIAVYLNGAPPKVHHQKAAQLLAGKKLPSLKSLVEEFREQELGYPAAGSFCGFLIETYGLEKFKEMYPTADAPAAFLKVLEMSLDDLERKWHEFLAAAGKD
jgi:hypothetical protein